MSASETVTSLTFLSDDPSTTDLLSFNAIAMVLDDALLDPELGPGALVHSGRWGSSKRQSSNWPRRLSAHAVLTQRASLMRA
jgi:hypothetical protein